MDGADYRNLDGGGNRAIRGVFFSIFNVSVAFCPSGAGSARFVAVWQARYYCYYYINSADDERLNITVSTFGWFFFRFPYANKRRLKPLQFNTAVTFFSIFVLLFFCFCHALKNLQTSREVRWFLINTSSSPVTRKNRSSTALEIHFRRNTQLRVVRVEGGEFSRSNSEQQEDYGNHEIALSRSVWPEHWIVFFTSLPPPAPTIRFLFYIMLLCIHIRVYCWIAVADKIITIYGRDLNNW